VHAEGSTDLESPCNSPWSQASADGLCHNRAKHRQDTLPYSHHSGLGMECAHRRKHFSESRDPSTSGESMDRTRVDIRDPPHDTSLAFVCHPSCTFQGKLLENPHSGKGHLVVVLSVLVVERDSLHLAVRRILDHCGRQGTISRAASNNEYEEDSSCQDYLYNNLNMRESADAHHSLSRESPDTSHSSLHLNPRMVDTQQDMEYARRRKMIHESHYSSSIALSMDCRQVGIRDRHDGTCLSSACHRGNRSIQGNSSECQGSRPRSR